MPQPSPKAVKPNWWRRFTYGISLARGFEANRPPILHDHFDAAESWAAQAGSAFFTVLPAEVRRKILITAFGDRTLHIVHWKNFKTGKDQWFGCLCLEEIDEDIARDTCVGRSTLTEDMHAVSHRREGVRIGAMGWLLSCSLAFAEGLEVLCATNTLDVRSETLRAADDDDDDDDILGGFLGGFLPAQHARLLTSVRWSLDPLFLARRDRSRELRGRGQGQGGAAADHLPRLAWLLRALPAALPALRRLYFGIDHNSWFWEDEPRHFKRRYQLFTRDVLPLLDEAARALAEGGGGSGERRLVDVEFAVPWSVFWPHFVVGLHTGVRFSAPNYVAEEGAGAGGIAGRGSYHQRRRIWRRVDVPVPVSAAGEQGGGGGGGAERRGEGEAAPGSGGPGRDAEQQQQQQQQQHEQRQLGYWLSGTRDSEDLPAGFCEDEEYTHLQPEVLRREGVAAFERAWSSPCHESAIGPRLAWSLCTGFLRG